MDCYFISDLHIDAHLPCLATGRRSSSVCHKWIDSNLLPADILCIAGDIADNSRAFFNFIMGCRNRYKYVVFVYGNHDIGVFDNEYESSLLKVEQMNTWLKNMTCLSKATHQIKTKIFRLDGNVPLDINGRLFAGCMGAPDWSYSKTVLRSTDKAFKKHWSEGLRKTGWKNWWTNDLSKIAEDEKSRLFAAVQDMHGISNIVLSHYVPLGMPTTKQYRKKVTTGFFYWDVADIINMLPTGTIWHYGHNHIANILEKNGILFLNNPIGFPGQETQLLKKYDKRDFLITI